MRRVEREKQMAFQNQRIEKHPHLVYFYTMNWNAILVRTGILTVQSEPSDVLGGLVE